jgi:hypothetical protein
LALVPSARVPGISAVTAVGMAQLAFSEDGINRATDRVWQTHAAARIFRTTDTLTAIISYALFQYLSSPVLLGADLVHSHHSDQAGTDSIIFSTINSFVVASTAVSKRQTMGVVKFGRTRGDRIHYSTRVFLAPTLAVTRNPD